MAGNARGALNRLEFKVQGLRFEVEMVLAYDVSGLTTLNLELATRNFELPGGADASADHRLDLIGQGGRRAAATGDKGPHVIRQFHDLLQRPSLHQA